MKESHRKGLAPHPDPESCVGRCRKAAIEALTGAHAGRVLSCEMSPPQSADGVSIPEGNIRDGARRAVAGLGAVEDPGMSGHSTRENRETPKPLVEDRCWSAGRSARP